MRLTDKLFKKNSEKENKRLASVQLKAQKFAFALQRSENATALDSGVVSLRLFYNALGQIFYKTGYHTEYFFIKLKRGIIDFTLTSLKIAKELSLKLKAACIKLVKLLLVDFAVPFSRIKQRFSAIKNEIDDEIESESYKVITKKGLRYAIASLFAAVHLIVPLFSYLLPIFTALTFVFVVNSFNEYNYGLNVTLNGNSIGIVENENIYEDAQMLVRERIRTVKDSEEWVIDPEFNISVADNSRLMSATQLADSMVKASSDKIQDATGIIVDGELLGVTTDGNALQMALNELKAPYEDPNNAKLTVSFVQDVQLVPGIYFTSSITDAQPIVDTIKGQVSGQKLYTVAKGDTPSGIAAKVGIPLKDLYALNPNIDPSVNKKISMFVGDQLLVSNAVEFLQVKTIENVTRQIPIPHQTNSNKSDQLAWGFQKVTQQGEDGVEERDINVTRIGGIIVNEEILASRILKEPVTEEITVGTKLANGNIAGDASTGVMMWPVPNYKGVSRDFRYDRGLDITAVYGSAIVAADNGVVTFAGSGAGSSYWSYGNFVKIQHSTGVLTLYAHMRNVAVSSGSYVKKGDVIGYVGLTGRTSGPHLHFETQVNGRAVDPYRFVKRG